MKIIGLIPARGGSKGIPKKNIKDYCGKPLIAHTIHQSLNSKYMFFYSKFLFLCIFGKTNFLF